MLKIIVLLILPTLNINSEEITPKSIINQVIEVYNQINSFSCIIEYSEKSYSSDDTIRTNAICNILKIKKDFLNYQLIWYSTDKDREIISLKDKSYKIIHSTKTIFEYLGKQHQENVIRGDVLERNFLNPEGVLITLNTNSIKYSIESINEDSISYWNIRFIMPNQWGRSDIQKNFWIDKKTNYMNKIETILKYQGNYQYKKWIMKNLITTNLDSNIILYRIDSLLKKYTLLNVDSLFVKSKQENPLLNNATKAPLISGYFYQKKQIVNLNNFEGKTILLDFWYMSCSPCVKAIPEINKLYNKYKKKGLIAIGINSNDDYHNKKRLQKFVEYNKINYPLLFVEKSVDSVYHIHAYPTLYLIDKTGKIVYTQEGYKLNKDNKPNTDSLEYYIKKSLKLK
ncbi:MAG: TlpA disulfide reductase family protein [bacterium]